VQQKWEGFNSEARILIKRRKTIHKLNPSMLTARNRIATEYDVLGDSANDNCHQVINSHVTFAIDYHQRMRLM